MTENVKRQMTPPPIPLRALLHPLFFVFPKYQYVYTYWVLGLSAEPKHTSVCLGVGGCGWVSVYISMCTSACFLCIKWFIIFTDLPVHQVYLPLIYPHWPLYQIRYTTADYSPSVTMHNVSNPHNNADEPPEDHHWPYVILVVDHSQ